MTALFAVRNDDVSLWGRNVEWRSLDLSFVLKELKQGETSFGKTEAVLMVNIL